MNDEYSEAFNTIIPDAPSVERWAEGARRKRRNRRGVIGGVAGVAVLALAVPFALSLQTPFSVVAAPGESGTRVAAPSPDPAADGPGAAACWEAPGQPRKATEDGVTVGAVRAWLCSDAGDPEMVPAEVGPLEPLVDDVDDIVEFIRESEVLREETACTVEGGTDYRIVLDYEGGSRRVVSGGLYGCGVIDDGDRKLMGSRELYGRALELWSKQRESVDAPGGTIAAGQCLPASRSELGDLLPALVPMLPFSPVDAVTGFSCGEDAGSFWGSILDADVVAVIAASVALESEEGLGEDYLPAWVTLTGPWGDSLRLQQLPGDVFQWFDEGTPMLWKPSPDVLGQVDAAIQLLARPTASPTNVTTSAPFESELCAGVASGEVTSTKLPEGVLSDSPTRIWVCGAIDSGMPPVVGPLEPLESSELTAEAVNFYNELGSVKSYPSCLNDYSPTYSVVHEYPDGTLHVLAVRTSDCDVITAGVHTKRGGREYVDELEKLWQEQREAEPSAQSRPGPLCPLLSSVFAIDPREAEFTGGQACVGWEVSKGGFVGPTEEVPLPATVLAELPAQMATATNEIPDGGPLGGGMGLVLLTPEGDPFSLFRSDNGMYNWYGEDGQRWFFTPTGTLADQLEEIFDS